MREELAGAAVAALDLVEDQKHAVLVAERAQAAHKLDAHGSDATFALHRLDQDRAGLGRNKRFDGLQVARRCVNETRERRAKALHIVRVTGRSDRAQGPAVERAGESDDLVTVGLALGPEVMTGRLDRALKRLGTRIGEEHTVSEGVVHQPLAEPLLLRNGEDVGGVPDLFGGSLQRADQMRIAVAERIDRDAGVEIEIRCSVLREQSHALAPLEGEVQTGHTSRKAQTSKHPFPWANSE